MNSEMIATTASCSRANEMSQHIKTCNVRHIFMPVDKTIKNKFPSHNNLLNSTFQSHPIKMGCCNTNKKCLIVTTINPIWHSHPVHHGTKFLVFTSLKSKETSSLHTIFNLLQKTNQTSHCLDSESSLFFLLKGLDTLFFSQSILTVIVQTIVSAV